MSKKPGISPAPKGPGPTDAGRITPDRPKPPAPLKIYPSDGV